MKNKLIFFFGILLFLFQSCSSEDKFWEISKFKMDEYALKENEEVKIVYSSRRPINYNEEQDYYFHYVVVSQKTGNTVNVLSAVENDISTNGDDVKYCFIRANHMRSILSQVGIDKPEKTPAINELSKSELRKYNKVVRDPKFDHIADNNYPTIIGLIVTVSYSTPVEQ